MFGSAAHAQSDDIAGARSLALSIVPTLSVSQTATDNARGGSRRGEPDLITTASAGVQVRKATGRVRGALDYSLSGVVYARDADENNFQNALRAFATAEVVEDRAFVDARASVSRQLISVFGTQLADNRLGNDNQAEVATFSISPYVRGNLAGLVGYEARLSHAASRSDSSRNADSNTSLASLQLNGGNQRRLLSWTATAARQSYDFSGGREVESDTLRAVLSLAINPQLSVSAIGGRESNDFTSLDKESRSIAGFGLTWLPTQRTRLAAERERRFFGNSHSVQFQHRMRRSAVRFSSSKNLVSDAERFSTSSFGTVFDLFFLQFESIEPDPVRRELLVNNFLRANGISPTTPVIGGFLSSAVTVEQRQELALTLQGIRDTVTFSATQSNSRRADTVVQVDDDFTNGATVRQRGFTVNWARRLSPVSSVNFGLAQQRSRGSFSGQSTELRTLNATWSSRLGERTTVSLGARRSEFDGSSNPYDEHAITGSLSMSF
jgi:uncharacterized protein (PEP-CTERM system associated)